MNRDVRKRLQLEGKGNVKETFRETIGLDAAERIAKSSMGIRKMSVMASWRSRPSPKRKKRLLGT
jgi:hypothetical protein